VFLPRPWPSVRRPYWHSCSPFSLHGSSVAAAPRDLVDCFVRSRKASALSPHSVQPNGCPVGQDRSHEIPDEARRVQRLLHDSCQIAWRIFWQSLSLLHRIDLPLMAHQLSCMVVPFTPPNNIIP